MALTCAYAIHKPLLVHLVTRMCEFTNCTPYITKSGGGGGGGGGVSNPYKITYNFDIIILHKMHVYCYTLLCCMLGIIHNLLLMCFLCVQASNY